MKRSNFIRRISLLTLFCLMLGALLTGCDKIDILDTGSLKIEKPETKYDEIGYGYKSSIDGNDIKITYALVGFLDGQIKYIYIDQIEKTLGEEKSLSTNREKKNAYGLAYTSDLGEWYVQLDALQSFILGHKMTLDDINNIETYQKDENNPSVPAPSSDLSAACELNIGDFLDAVKMAYTNKTEVEAIKVGIGEDIRIYNAEESAKITLSVVAYDYNQNICFSRFESFDVSAKDTEIVSLRDSSKENATLAQIQKNVEGYEQYMIGRSITDCTNVEVYSSDDGSALSLPKPNTDLALVCNIDLNYYICAASEAYNRAS